MDNLTHTLIGVTVANAGLKQKLGKGTVWTLAIASNITDIDVFWGFVHAGESFLFRRMLTHSIVGMPLLTIVCGWIFSRIFKNLTFKTAMGLCLLGISLHVFFDLLNSFGVVLLYPFDKRRFDLSWVFIIDLAIWSMLAAPLLMSILPQCRRYLLRGSQIALACLTVYVAFCGTARWRAGALLRKWVSDQTATATALHIFPEALGAHRFRGVARLGEEYHSLLLYPLTGAIEHKSSIPTAEAHPDVQIIKNSEEAKQLDWFFKAPVWKEISPGQWEVFDLQFQSEVVGRNNPFSYKFELENGRVIYRG